MFSIFKMVRVREFPDKIWKTQQVAWKEAATEALRILKASETPVIVFFFPETHKRFVDFLRELNVPEKEMEPGYDLENNVVYTVGASVLESDQILNTLKQRSASSKVRFIFLGRYPLSHKEHPLTQKIISVMGEGTPISFWLSFDDQLLKRFGGDKVLPLMEKLGVKDDECIEHSFVTKSIANARKKIEAKVRSEISADSEEQWFERNLGAM
jgi:hypothetical protein